MTPATRGIVVCSETVHAERCHHRAYMRQGIEWFLAHPQVRRNLTLMLSQTPAPMDPQQWAVGILVQLAASVDTLDTMAPECDTPEVEMALEPVTGDELTTLDVWLSQATSR